MDLNTLVAFLSSLGPWGIVVGAVLVLLVQKSGLKLPSLPSLPSSPPTPVVPAPNPVSPALPNIPDLLGIGERPVLRLLLSWFALKSSGGVTAADSALLDTLHKEIGDLKSNLPK